MSTPAGRYFTISDYCRFLIVEGDLASKLAPPRQADGSPLRLDRPASVLLTEPGRSKHLEMSGKAAKLPKLHELGSSEARARCIHRFAHHELQAVELFAWAILRWPEMPDAMKTDILETIAEEQKHLRLYLKCLESHGVQFGDYPLSDYFWRHAATLDQSPAGPRAFLSAMGLTLEQANLDFALMYKAAFERAGDHETARAMQIIHDDEVGHVRLAKIWLARLEGGQDDLANYMNTVPFPFGPTRARGRQFHAESREKALLDPKFIEYVRNARKPHPRKPVVLYQNFGAEEAHKPKNKDHVASIRTLFQAFWQIRDSTEDLHPALASPNPLLPVVNTEWVVPWLATVDAQGRADALGRRLWGASYELVDKWHAKAQALAWAQERQFECDPLKQSVTFLRPEFFQIPGADQRLLGMIDKLPDELKARITIKPNWGFSGRGRAGMEAQRNVDQVMGAARRMCHRRRGAILEPWLDRVADYSVLLWLHEDGTHALHVLKLLNTSSGVYCGHESRVPSDVRRDLAQMGEALARDLHSEKYVGPVGVDAFSFRLDGREWLRPVVEINARMTMGHLARWVTSYFSGAERVLFAFHPRMRSQRPEWARESHLLFENGPVVFSA